MIDVALTPRDLRPAAKAVVIDVLRASSSISQALAAGYERVHCCARVDEAERLRAPGRVIAGERSCVKPSGFDLGNSPWEFEHPIGREVVLTTTNGCPALLAAGDAAAEVLVGCLLNLGALLDELESSDELVLVCAGTDGEPALEDTYMAGRIVATLGGERTDSAAIAESVARDYPNAATALAASADAAALRALGLEADVGWCARESVVDVVPRMVGRAEGAAVLEAGKRPPAPTSGIGAALDSEPIEITL